MKNLIVNIFKTLFFFDLAVIAVTFIPDIKTKSDAVLTLWHESKLLMVVLFLTVFFLFFVEKRKMRLIPKKGKIKSFFLGAMFGLVLPIVVLLIMWLFKSFRFSGFNKVSELWIWISAVFINALGYELLLRGYLFKLYRKHHGFLFATFFTTALFLCLNTELFTLPKSFIATIIIMNLLLCFLADYTQNPISNIMAHFCYVLVSGFAFGGKLFIEKYPLLGKFAFSGKPLINGGEYQIEGSIITLIIVSVLVAFLFVKKYTLWKYLSKKYIISYMDGIKAFFLNLKGFAKRIVRIK